ncbi:MAG: LysM peptidoglycan-binding domain-containing protein [Gammaproteobacteria bacterium]|nr:LysM peptidoglycan-binding domain-containing protein [Gammaproteobacteria bacterium]
MYKKSTLFMALMCSLALVSPNVSYANTEANLKTLLGKLISLEHALAKRPANDESNLLAPGSSYKIEPGDTLATIAKRAYGDTGVRLNLIKNMIVDNNSHAFFRDNPNFIYAGKTIAIPSVDDLRELIFKDTQTQVFTSQSKAHWIRFP